MAKKKPKHGGTLTLRSMSPDQLLQLAQKSIDDGKLRIARDAYKELVRIDQKKYLPDLLRCYNLLAENMAANNQLVEARNMLAYAKELGGDSAVTFKIDQYVADYNSQYDLSLISLVRLTRSGEIIPADVKFRAADAAIAFAEIPSEIPESFRCDHDSICSALNFVCDKEYDLAIATLKPMSFESPFSQWKLLIRGMCCFYTGDDQRAQTAFNKICVSTVPADLAKSYLILLDHKKYLTNDDNNRENELKMACLLSGYPELEGVLPRAQYLWMTKRLRDSFIHVEKSMPNFPSLETCIAGNLTNLYFNILHHLDHAKSERYIEVIETFTDSFDGWHYSLMYMLCQRAMCIFSLNCVNFCEEELYDLWENFINIHQKLFGVDKSLQAEMYLFLGIEFGLKKRLPDPYFFPARRKKKEKSYIAEICLQKAVETGGSKDAYCKLLEYYHSIDSKKNCRQIIENAVNAFPQDKDLLVQAGLMAISRKSVFKGVEYLERALTLDSIDAVLRGLLVVNYISVAASALKTKDGVKKMRNYMVKAESLCINGANGFHSEKRYIVVRRAALEFIAGNEKNGNEELKRAFGYDGNKVTLVYFAYLLFRTYNVQIQYWIELEKEIEALTQSSLTIEKACNFLDVLEYAKNLEGIKIIGEERNRVLKYATSVFQTVAFEPDDIKKFIDFSEANKETRFTKDFIKLAIKSDQSSPVYRFYDFKSKNERLNYIPPEKHRNLKKKLQAILDDAIICSDQQLIQQINNELKRLDSLLLDRFNFPHPFNDFDLDKNLDELRRNLQDSEEFFEDFPGSGDDDDDDFFTEKKSQKKKKKKTNSDRSINSKQLDLFGGEA